MSVDVKIPTASDAGKTMCWTCDRCMVSTQSIPLCLEYLSQWRGLNLRVCLYHLSSSSIWFYPTFASCSSMIICWLLVAYRGVQSDRLDHQSTLQPSLVHLLVFFPLLAMETTSLQKHVSFCFFCFFFKKIRKQDYGLRIYVQHSQKTHWYLDAAAKVNLPWKKQWIVCDQAIHRFCCRRSVKNVRSLWGSDCNQNSLCFCFNPLNISNLWKMNWWLGKHIES